MALDGRALADGALLRKKIAIIFGVFSHFHFAECKYLPSAFPVLGKAFAECISGFADAECRRHLAK